MPSTTLQSAASAAGNGTTLDMRGMAGAAIRISGTFVAVLSCEGTSDGSHWAPLHLLARGDGEEYGQVSATGDYVVEAAGLQSLRVPIVARTSGTITVVARPARTLLGLLSALVGSVVTSDIAQMLAANAALALQPLGAPPATPATNVLALYNDGGVLKAKADDGNVTTVAGRGA